MLQTSESPELGLAFFQFLLVILFAYWITFDSDLGQGNAVYGSVQLSIAERIGVHPVLPARRVRHGGNTGMEK